MQKPQLKVQLLQKTGEDIAPIRPILYSLQKLRLYNNNSNTGLNSIFGGGEEGILGEEEGEDFWGDVCAMR